MSEKQSFHNQEGDEYRRDLRHGLLFRPDNNWSEPLKLLWTYKLVLVNIVFASYFAQGRFMPGRETLPWYIAAAAIYIGGRLADKISTIKVLEKMQQADELGIEHGIVETNPYLPAKPSKEDLFGRRKTSLDAGTMISGIILPPLGVFYGAASGGVALFNTRVGKNLEKQIQSHQ